MLIKLKLSTFQRNQVNLESLKDIETKKKTIDNILNNKLLWVLYLQSYKN